ncbi:MAG: hypothetical protein ACLFVG_04640 [Candidatus Aminicenantes bacterium]
MAIFVTLCMRLWRGIWTAATRSVGLRGFSVELLMAAEERSEYF